MRSSIENGNLGLADQRLRADRGAHQVVAIERDVERADGDVVAGDLALSRGDAPRERHAAAAHADEREIGQTAVAFEDFVGDARERARDALRIHDYRHIIPLCGLSGPRLKRLAEYIRSDRLLSRLRFRIERRIGARSSAAAISAFTAGPIEILRIGDADVANHARRCPAANPPGSGSVSPSKKYRLIHFR